jgi:hypothetical protein
MQPIDLFCWWCGGFRDDNLGYLQTRSFPHLRPRHSNRLVDAYKLEPPRFRQVVQAVATLDLAGRVSYQARSMTDASAGERGGAGS